MYTRTEAGPEAGTNNNKGAKKANAERRGDGAAMSLSPGKHAQNTDRPMPKARMRRKQRTFMPNRKEGRHKAHRKRNKTRQ